MIDLKVDLSYLANYYHLPVVAPNSRQEISQSKNIKEQGGDPLTITTKDGQITVDAKLLRRLIQDPDKLAKIMQLLDPENRYLIIKELSEEDLVKILPFLSSEQLSMGLYYLNKDGLQVAMNNLPKEQVVELLLMNFTMEDVTAYMQSNEMDNFLKGSKLQRYDVMEYFKSMDYEKFKKVMVNQFGSEYENKTAEEYLEKIENMRDSEYKKFLLNMKGKEKAEMISGLCEINPDYYLEFENDVLTRPIFNTMQKVDIIDMMSKLDPEFLVPIIENLPKNFIEIVATQIDPNVFAKMLSGEFPDLLMKMLAG